MEAFHERGAIHVLLLMVRTMMGVGVRHVDDISIVRDRGGYKECVGRANEGQDVNHAVSMADPGRPGPLDAWTET